MRVGRTGEQIAQELHGRYYEQAFRKNLFHAYCAAQAMSVVGTGMVGLQVYNPVASGVNLVLLKAAGAIVVTSATTTGIVLASAAGQTTAPTGQTAATKSGNNFLGAAGSAALALAAGTFTNAPTADLFLMHNTAAIAATGEDQGFSVDLEGSIIVPPAAYVCIAALGAAGAASSTFLHLMWEEVPT
jgi:hypothetical protein